MSQMPSKQTNNILNAIMPAQGQAGIGAVCIRLYIQLYIKPLSQSEYSTLSGSCCRKPVNHCCISHCHLPASVPQPLTFYRATTGPLFSSVLIYPRRLVNPTVSRPERHTVSSYEKRDFSPCAAHLPRTK